MAFSRTKKLLFPVFLFLMFSLPSTLADCGSSPADIVILMDSSVSVGSTNFEKQKNFVASFAESFDISPFSVQIGIVTFASTPNNEFNLNTFQTKADTINAIYTISYQYGGTRTDLGLKYAAENSFTTPSGDRTGAINILIVITDGYSNQPELTRQEATKLHQMNIKVFAIGIGIGTGVDKTELGYIASGAEYVFQINNFDAFDSIRDVLKKTACKVSCPPGEYFGSNDLCQPCATGTFRTGLEGENCLPCPDGLTTSTEGATDESQCIAILCPAGQYFGADGLCQSCPVGTYKSALEEENCLSCSDGTTTLTVGATDESQCIPITCPAGQYLGSNNLCQPCTTGTFRTGLGGDGCLPCPGGRTTAADGATDESQCIAITCPAGQYLELNYLCEPCTTGTFRTGLDGDNCLPCPDGQTTLSDGATGESQCVPIICPAGQYLGLNYLCEHCAIGTFRTGLDGETCLPCLDGQTTLTDGATDDSECVAVTCPAGQYLGLNYLCESCATGTYKTGLDGETCMPCPEGQTTVAEGATDESQCVVCGSKFQCSAVGHLL